MMFRRNKKKLFRCYFQLRCDGDAESDSGASAMCDNNDANTVDFIVRIQENRLAESERRKTETETREAISSQILLLFGDDEICVTSSCDAAAAVADEHFALFVAGERVRRTLENEINAAARTADDFLVFHLTEIDSLPIPLYGRHAKFTERLAARA